MDVTGGAPEGDGKSQIVEPRVRNNGLPKNTSARTNKFWVLRSKLVVSNPQSFSTK
jgi:hypothetical protein